MSGGEREQDYLFGFLNASDTSHLLRIIQQQQQQQQHKNGSEQVGKLSLWKTTMEMESPLRQKKMSITD